MPGISLHYNLTKIKAQDYERFADILSGMCHYPSYSSKVIYSDQNIIIGFSGYDSYPIKTIELENCRVFLEGMIYDRPDKDLKWALSRISETAFNGNHSNSELARLIEHTLGEYDGEFWLTAIDNNSRKCLIMNDCYGKLPLYYHISNDGLTVSREIKFVQKYNHLGKPDLHGIAWMLKLKYVLGDRTLLSEVKRYPAASFLKIIDGKGRDTIAAYHVMDLSEYEGDKPAGAYIDELIDIFRNVINNRERSRYSDHSVIGLSGGLDSRAVLGGLNKFGWEPVPASSLDHDRINLHDVEVAEQVAALYKPGFRKIILPKTAWDKHQRIIALKDGMNNAVMAMALGLYDNLLSDFEFGANFYTGDGGASIKTAYRMPKIINSEKQFRKYLFEIPSVFPDEILEDLLDISMAEMRAEFMAEVEKYPAGGWSEKYFHYIVCDYLANFGYEGEDRTRFFFRTQAAFEARPFYSHALRIPDRYKDDLKLMGGFLKALDPRLTKIEYADFKAPLDSGRLLLTLRARRFLKNHPGLLRPMRKLRSPALYGPGRSGSDFKSDMFATINRSELLPRFFNRDSLLKTLGSDLNRMQYYALLTIILYMNQLERDMRE